MNDPGHRHGTPEDLAYEFPTDNGRPRPLTLKDFENGIADVATILRKKAREFQTKGDHETADAIFDHLNKTGHSWTGLYREFNAYQMEHDWQHGTALRAFAKMYGLTTRECTLVLQADRKASQS